MQKLSDRSKGEQTTRLFGGDFTYNTGDDIGRAIHSFGLYDLCVSEALWLLTEPGGVVLDIGANIGYFSSLLSERVGEQGRVHSFDPNPHIFSVLKDNTQMKKNVVVHAVALSETSSERTLFGPKDYAENRGLASLNADGAIPIATVPLRPLDSFSLTPQLIKMDVEGHELSVLKGAENTLTSVKHIIFEDHDLEINGVKNFLEARGFELYYLQKTFFGLRLGMTSKTVRIDPSEPPNFLATRWSRDKINAAISRGKWSFIRRLRAES